MADTSSSGIGPDSHSFIKDIVSQVKSGKKNKAEAFSQLKQILQAGKTTEVAPSSGDVALSEEERSNLINRIAVNKRDQNFDPANESVEESTIFSSTDMGGAIEYEQPPRMASFQPRETPGKDIRMQRIAQAESVIRGEMFKECTFQPKIKTLPASYNATSDVGTPFYDRVTKWQREKEVEGARRAELVNESVTVDCTFHPRINPSSDRAVRQIRGTDPVESASDRLYKSNETAQYQRSKFIEDELRKEKLEEDQACTFRPHLSTQKKKFAFVKSKYDQPLQRDREGFGAENLDDPSIKECTFTPKVKGVRSNMSSAKLYVGTNVVDRLTRPVTAPSSMDDSARFDQVGDGSVMDVASFMGSLAGTGMGFATPARDAGRASSAPRQRGGEPVVLTAEEKAKRAQAFKEFLGRQSQVKVKKETKVKEVERAQTPKFQPRLCKKSLEMTNASYSGDFINRVERDVSRRADQAIKRETFVDTEASFQPRVNQRSQKLVSRSAAEMSKGDMLRKAANYRMMKLKTEQETMSEYTFQPIISKRAQSSGRGKVKLSTDPSAVVEMYRETQRLREEERVRRQMEREESDMAECTFQPQTKRCPQYVTNIAKSMEIVRNARQVEAQQKSSRPDWR